MTPALPPATGPNPAKAKFFEEAAGAFELMALWYGMSVEEQTEFKELVVSFSVKQMERKQKEKK
jgi:hypothetical protein